MSVHPIVAGIVSSLQAHKLFLEVDDLYGDVRRRGAERLASWTAVIRRRSFLLGAANLSVYLAFRERDLRALQDRLVPLGLSSLGRCEAHVMASIQAVRATLASLSGVSEAMTERPNLRDFAFGEQMLRHNTHAVFGSARRDRPLIMVTLASEAATDYAAVQRLVEAGADVARINCAHDTPTLWKAMATNVRRAARETHKTCRVYMDIAGPKIRVGAVLTHKRTHRFESGDHVELTSSEPIVYGAVAAGQVVWIDDGKLGARVVEPADDRLRLRITHAPKKGRKIRPDHGLNFPGLAIDLPALSEGDLADLDCIGQDADMIGQSFVRNAADIGELLAQCEKRSIRLPIIAKIETTDAIANLPEIIVAGASKVPFGVMIARGDLALEIGYPRLAEMQEELLWVCEAAHVPVVWATQVLDQFVKTGIPTRAEITDAAMAEQAECVMLNKGDFIVDAVATLSNVLARMRGHQLKKSSRLRALRAWTRQRVP